MNNLAQEIKAFVCQDFQHVFGESKVKADSSEDWQKLKQVGTELWLDTGDLDEAAKLWVSEFSALTTNNTLLNKEIQKGIYDDLIPRAAAKIKELAPGIEKQKLVLEIAFILNAYHGLKLVDQFDANVSVELHTDLANNVDLTVEYGKRYYDICPERFYVKVPLTPAGFIGAGKLREAGIPINFTLGFSARQNYFAAVFTQPAYVNVFMGRLNAFVADNELGDGQNVGEKATLATQRALLELRNEQKSVSKLIGASMRAGEQVATLAGLDVYTMPPKVAAQYVEKPVESISSQVINDPEVKLNQGINLEDFDGGSLWNVSDEFKSAVNEFMKKYLSSVAPDDITGYFTEAGFPDFLPLWTDEEIQTAATDGKIPVLNHWQDKLKEKKIGLDALMNLSALQSFVGDQKALDDRVRGII